MPTRVIDLGSNIETDYVSLASGVQPEHYLALSHCWGEVTDPPWLTTKHNVESRKGEGFRISDLPATFQDAIKVTRSLGKRYLWIDSLCIIQQDAEDWNAESSKMQGVFKNAYCTIAASSAKDSTVGFLHRAGNTRSLATRYTRVPATSTEPVDNFVRDVNESHLNTRAWVFQERLLSRRTIHFTDTQAYWECGGGLRSETLTHMDNGKALFRSDPDFPQIISQITTIAQVEQFQSLFEDYTRLDISYKTDRPRAVLSLATEVARALDTKLVHGVFGEYLHESILWHRSQDESLEKIDYGDGKALPSWSWLTYFGRIKYMRHKSNEGWGFDIDTCDVEWDRGVELCGEEEDPILKARGAKLRNSVVIPEGSHHVLTYMGDTDTNDSEFGGTDADDSEVERVYFDDGQGRNMEEVHCAIVGRKEKIYGVLILEKSESGEDRFRRIGMGWVYRRFVLFPKETLWVSIE